MQFTTNTLTSKLSATCHVSKIHRTFFSYYFCNKHKLKSVINVIDLKLTFSHFCNSLISKSRMAGGPAALVEIDFSHKTCLSLSGSYDFHALPEMEEKHNI